MRAALSVMAGLVPAIHAADRFAVPEFDDDLSSQLKIQQLRAAAWMPGTSPGMTAAAQSAIIIA